MLGMRIGGEDITKMSNSLAKFYKKSLSKGKNIILIKDEIEQVHAYMDIQNIRFKGKINVVFEIDDSILEARSLKLMLQPFVENAIAHGMYKEKKTLNIRIVVCKDGENILWEVIDDGIGISKVRLKSILNSEENAESGYGIVNVDQRIKLFFGDNYGVSIYSRVGIGTAVRIVTPYMTASL
jgi:two-component system, sensor histidine kinase YesM